MFAKGDRLRLEYKYAVKTELGYSSIEIIRLDKRESWFLLAQRRQILPVPIKPEDILPIQPGLPGETQRTLVGDATTIGRPSKLYEVRVDYNGRNERFYEWVDVETGVLLKLVSQDRDWSIEYLRIRFSPQPDYYFDEPVGYKRWVPPLRLKKRVARPAATFLRKGMQVKPERNKCGNRVDGSHSWSCGGRGFVWCLLRCRREQ